MFGWLKKRNRERELEAQVLNMRNRLSAAYDGASMSNPDLNEYWAQADHLSAHAANSREVRRRIRSRVRYEVHESNSVAKRILQAKVGDVIGARGPKLQVEHPDQDVARAVEVRWNEWCKAINFSAKLRTLYTARLADGEGFAQRIINPRLPFDMPQTDIQVSEADLWTDPTGFEETNESDGIFHDSTGDPLRYTKLAHHPGDRTVTDPLATETLAAQDVIHWFRQDRPGQTRGISEFAPALPLFAELRRYRLACLTAAETAADFAVIMQAKIPASARAMPASLPKDMKSMSIVRRMLTKIPMGWEASQLKPEQPTAEFDQFSDSIYKDIGGCTRTPLNIVTGSSRDYNFTSGRLDYHIYYSANDEDRFSCEQVVLNTVFDWWLEEALMIPGYLPSLGEFTRDTLPIRWVFESREPIDPVKQAQADQIKFNLGYLPDDDYAMREGFDPEEFAKRQRKTIERRKEMGAPLPGGQLSTGGDNAEQENETAETPA